MDELVDPELLNLRLRPEAKLFFDLHLDPQPLAVEPVLVADVVPGHRKEPLERILVGAAPGVMDAHRVVRRHRPVEKTPGFAVAGILRTAFLEDVPVAPEPQDLVLAVNEIGIGNFLEHGRSSGLGENRSYGGPGPVGARLNSNTRKHPAATRHTLYGRGWETGF